MKARALPILLGVALPLAGCQPSERVVVPPTRWESTAMLAGTPIPMFLPLTIDETVGGSERELMGFRGPVRAVTARQRFFDPEIDYEVVTTTELAFGTAGRLQQTDTTTDMGAAELIDTGYGGYQNLRVIHGDGVLVFSFDLDGRLASAMREGAFDGYAMFWDDDGFTLRGPESFPEGHRYTLDARGRVLRADLSHRAHGMVISPRVYRYDYVDDARGNWTELVITHESGHESGHEGEPGAEPAAVWVIERTIEYHP